MPYLLKSATENIFVQGKSSYQSGQTLVTSYPEALSASVSFSVVSDIATEFPKGERADATKLCHLLWNLTLVLIGAELS